MGHVEVLRHMNLPIFEEDHIVLVVGVGNKPVKYTMEDAQNVGDLMKRLANVQPDALDGNLVK